MERNNWFLVAVLMVGGLIIFVILANLLSSGNRFNHEEVVSVFLQTGQVYFGNVEKETSNEIVLTNIFYLKFADSPGHSLQVQSESQVLDFELIKRGKELHGPEDRMVINKNYVLFIEPLREDSLLLEKIKNYKPSE